MAPAGAAACRRPRPERRRRGRCTPGVVVWSGEVSMPRPWRPARANPQEAADASRRSTDAAARSRLGEPWHAPRPFRSGARPPHGDGHRDPPPARRAAARARPSGPARAARDDRRVRPAPPWREPATRRGAIRGDDRRGRPRVDRARRAAPVPALLDKALVYVTGKGGAGKTTVAAALGLASAARGRRAIVCDLAGSDQLARAFGRPPGARRRAASDGAAVRRFRSTRRRRSRSGSAASRAAPRRSPCSRARRRSPTSWPRRPGRRSSSRSARSSTSRGARRPSPTTS